MFLIRSVYFLYVLTFLKQFYLNNKLVIKILLVLSFICNAKYLKRKSYKSLCSIQFTFHTFSYHNNYFEFDQVFNKL